MSRDDWPRLGRLVRHRREVLGLTQQDAVNRVEGSISVATWRNIETATSPPFRRAGLLAVCRALGWTAESIEQILDGGEPTELRPDRPSQDDIEARLADITRRLEEALAEVEELRLGRQRNDTAGHGA